MPIKVSCSKCGYVLREDNGYSIGWQAQFGFGYMENIIRTFNGKCPKCGRTLSLPPKTVDVSPFKRESWFFTSSHSAKAGLRVIRWAQQKIVEVGSQLTSVLPPPASKL